MTGKKIDFKAINQAALNCFDRLLKEWLPHGRRESGEWKSINPTRADSKVGSFSINIRTGVWSDFAVGDKGSDPVSLYAYLFHDNDQGAAAKELSTRLGINSGDPVHRLSNDSAPAPAQDRRRTEWKPIHPVPEDALPPPDAHIKRRYPERTWCYRDAEGRVLGYVYRFKTSDGGKEVLPLSYCENESGAREWRWISFSDPRPLYRLDALAKHPEAAVLIVEGEKCADAAAEMLYEKKICVLSWPGGGKADGKADFSVLAGRKVILWADADSKREKLSKEELENGIDPKSKPFLPKEKQPGFQTMHRIGSRLQDLGCKVWDVDIGEVGDYPDGWDVADLVETGIDDLADYLRANMSLRAAASKGEESNSPPPEAGAGARKGPEWREGLIYKSQGALEECFQNVFLILNRHPAWRGKIGFNEFSGRIEKRDRIPTGGDPGEWTAIDDKETSLWLAQNCDLVIKTDGPMTAGLDMVAMKNQFHPVRAWIDKLKWDGVERLDHFYHECMGTMHSPYFSMCGKFFFIGMVARVYRPGCAMQYMPILEGKQGKGKSTALRILGGDWYAETPFKVGDKDAYMQIAGVLLYEIPEMDSFNRAEATAVKAFVTIQVDRYREPYARRLVTRPRQCVFAGNTNHAEYFKDPTGNRRFWPIRCGEIDLQKISDWREQLFAEAKHRFDQGERWHPTREEEEQHFAPEQEEREIVDPWLYPLMQYLEEPENRHLEKITSTDILKDVFHVSFDKIDNNRGMATRIGNLMKRIGWEKRREASGLREWYYARPTLQGKVNVPF